MITLGYIISSKKDASVSEDIVKYVTSETDCILNIPKLIVGLKEAKEYAHNHGFEFDILDNTFQNGDKWTFKKTEKRQIYEKDIKDFKLYIKNKLKERVSYYYIDIYKLSYSNIKKLYNIFINNSLNRNVNYIIIDKGMLYINLEESKSMGISLNNLEYIGIDPEKVIKTLKNKQYNKVYYTTSKNMWPLKNEFNGNEYIIATLFQNLAKK